VVVLANSSENICCMCRGSGQPHEKQICGAVLYSKTYVIFFSKWKKNRKTEERNFVKTTSLLTLEEHFASGLTGKFF
jgi:hypothetical protein